MRGFLLLRTLLPYNATAYFHYVIVMKCVKGFVLGVTVVYNTPIPHQ